jgi:hypothetical protein
VNNHMADRVHLITASKKKQKVGDPPCLLPEIVQTKHTVHATDHQHFIQPTSTAFSPKPWFLG